METFSGILGNKPVLRLLEGALESGEVAHAYLFHGPPGVGKKTVARRFGAALVSGGEVAAESRALRGLHPDLSEIEPEGQFTTIRQIREVVRLVASRPFEGARRVFILRADTLNIQAANALLKTLEEPEGEPVFILLATSREGVLPTIGSRAQVVRFDPVPGNGIISFLMERGHSEKEARLAAALGRGSVGLALQYAEEDEFKELRKAVFGAGFSLDGSFEDRYEAVEKILSMAEGVGAAREQAYVAAYSETKGEPERRAKESAKRLGRAARDEAVAEALELLALLYRDVAAVAVGASEFVANADRMAEIQTCVGKYPGTDWAEAACIFREARLSLAYNVSPEAILEVALSRTRQKILRTSPGW